jgi:hypothetical protein
MIRCDRFRAYEKNTLRGFADLELPRVGIIIRDCTWHMKDGKEWVNFPAKTYQDKNGNTLWQPLIEFAEGAKEARAQFQRQALDAIHAAAAHATTVGDQSETNSTSRSKPKHDGRVSVAGGTVGCPSSRNIAADDNFHNDPIPF